MKNSKFTLGILLLCAQGSFAQTSSFSLEDAKSYALEHNISVQNAAYDVESSEYQKRETIGMGLPQISFSGSFNNSLNLPVQVISAEFFDPSAPPGSLVSFRAGTDYSLNGVLSVNQLLFNGSYLVGLQVASHYRKLQESAQSMTQESVIFNVIQAYQIASVSKENMAFIDSMVILTQNLVDKQNNYFELGLLTQEDIDQLNYSLLSVKQSQTQALLQYENAIELLKFSMGFPSDQQIEITATPEELMTKSAISRGDLHANLNYGMQEKQITMSEYNLKNEKSAFLPTLNAYFQHGYYAYRNEFNFFASDQPYFPQTSWGLQLNIPIFSSGQRYYRSAQAKVRLLKDQNSLAQLEQSLKMQEMQALNQVTSSQANYEMLKANVELAQTIYENAVTREQIGSGNSIVVTQKYNQLVMAQTQLVGSTIDLLNAKLSLDKLYNNILQP